MIEETKKRYKQLAENFYKTKITGDVTAQKIADALTANAEQYRPDYFRRLRNALAYDQESKGYKKAVKKINAVVNPVTVKGSNLAKKPKERRVKSINEKDYIRLTNHIKDSKDVVLLACVMISKELGCRPVELFNIDVREGKIFIEGAKKSNGNRGLDRLIDYEDVDGLSTAIHVLQAYKEKTKGYKSSASKLVQAKLANATKELWPRRKARASFYTFRHQQGSNLKASGMDRKEIAYIMGHQATKSVDVYGDKRSSNSKVTVKAGISADAISAVVRENHTTAPAKVADYGSSLEY